MSILFIISPLIIAYTIIYTINKKAHFTQGGRIGVTPQPEICEREAYYNMSKISAQDNSELMNDFHIEIFGIILFNATFVFGILFNYQYNILTTKTILTKVSKI